MKRKSYLVNFSTDALFVVLEQNQNELLRLQIKAIDNSHLLLNQRINQVKYTIAIIENTIIERFSCEKITLNKLIELLLDSNNDSRSRIYKELITNKMIDSNELVSLDLLDKVIKLLEVEQLMRIIKARENTIYGQLAISSYNQKCLEVDDEVYKELLVKIKQDRREC